MAITGRVERDGTVTITWNIQSTKLPAPYWEGSHYLPCEICGVLQAVGSNIVSCVCNRCGDFHQRGFELNDKQVENVVEFIQDLDSHDREVMLALQPGEEMNMGGGAAPLFLLRRML